MFKPDKWGSTFFFVDMDINAQGVKGGYAELARELSFWKFPVSIHVEYNGGLNNEMSFFNAYLGGATYTYNTPSYNAGVTFSALYKYLQDYEQPNSFQLTATWYYNFHKDMFTFCGFADFWKERRAWQGTDYIFITEPQFWFNLNALKGVNKECNLSIGTEVELSSNFVSKGFTCIPTLALKWTFR